MITIENLHKLFGDNKVLKGVNLTIEKGKTFAIIGRSGCGKSVLLKHIIGILKPDKGKILIDGCDITKISESDPETETLMEMSDFISRLDGMGDEYYVNKTHLNVEGSKFFTKVLVSDPVWFFK